MSRNQETHFSNLPNFGTPRSKFSIPFNTKTTFNAGKLIPFYFQDCLPGDQHKISTSKVIRMQTLLTPFMQEIYADTYYFYVPNRLLWSHWKNFMGESNVAWTPTVEYTEPQIEAPATTGWTKGSVADYMGLPTGVPGFKSSALPFRAYALIYSEFFRDENLQDPLNIPIGDATQTGVNSGTLTTDCASGMLAPINRLHDVFSSCLPSAQKGNAVTVNIGNMTGAVYGTGKALALTDNVHYGGVKSLTSARLDAHTSLFGKDVGTASTTGPDMTYDVALGVPTKDQISNLVGSTPDMTGLVADIAGSSLISINELRVAFQTQKFYERLAMAGSRYVEIIAGMFGVKSPDARLQRPEYLGGNRIPISVCQTVQTSGTGTTGTPQGTTTAYSLTTDNHFDVNYSCTEHGWIIGLMCVRWKNTYQQGCPRNFSRKTRFDYFWPLLQSIGNVGVKNKEIYSQGDTVINPDTGKPFDDEIFGYQEAWYEYRNKTNNVTGEMRSGYTTPLDSWHLADDYNALPTLSETWMQVDESTVDRVLAVSARTADQFFADILVDDEAVRPIPVYSIPGLLDHH